MDHQRIYNEIINRAQDRVLDVNQYYESHHVIPKCMGGTDDILNKISLTYREHKMTRGERSFLSKWDPEKLVSIDKMLN
jgi:hypothetical protein